MLARALSLTMLCGLAWLGYGHATDPGWSEDLAGGLARARASDRPLVVAFSRSDRPLARGLDPVWRADEVVDLLRDDLIAVRLDARAESTAFETLVGAPGALATCVLDSAGEPVAVLRGVAGPGELASFLRAGRDLALAPPADPVELAERLLELGSTARARALLEPRTADPRALDLLARLAADEGRNLKARAHLAAACRLAPADTEHRQLTEARVLRLERREGEALALLRSLPGARAAELADLFERPPTPHDR